MPRTFTLKTLYIILEQVFMLANQHVYYRLAHLSGTFKITATDF